MLKFARGALKLRYLFLGSAVGGSVSLGRKYDEWKASLPDMPDIRWLKELFPSQESLDDMSFRLEEWTRGLSERSREKMNTLSEWIDEAKTSLQNSSNDNQLLLLGPEPRPSRSILAPPVIQSDVNDNVDKPPSKSISQTISGAFKSIGNSERFENLQSELKRKDEESVKRNEELIRARKEMDKLKKENRELRSIIRANDAGIIQKRKLKKSLIEMYSEVLDELSGYDSSYKIQDHLPKVVVVGDQSAGKTSVLEMIAGARIFPRGAGEMMTRSPVQVILSEGPYHVARFNDSNREYDLTKESELAELRREVELRMKRSVQNGKTVSNQMISLTIQGPGLQRMVLVDLPGIISTNTSDLAPDTRESIKAMVTEYMGNPNAIILCIQDGSLDAERSIVTDLVHNVDKKGRRTILVLTKVDLAERTHTNPDKIKKILDGELFPIKAMGYYAVVAGKGGRDENIQEIKDYEEQYFLNSPLCQRGILDPSQCTTRNLSSKVSECFWSMVKASVEQQADTYKATLFNLEAEWNNTFPHTRQLVRDELFLNGKNEILNEVVNLSRLSTKHWDALLTNMLWESIKDHVFENIYFPASSNPLHFNAKVDIHLKRWVESLELPKLAINIAKESIKHEFDRLLSTPKKNKGASKNLDHEMFDELKKAVVTEALARHDWKPQAINVLKVVQNEALAKQTTLTKENWDKAIAFLQNCLSEHVTNSNQQLAELTGPSFAQRWLKWRSLSPEQYTNTLIKNELKSFLHVQASRADDNSSHNVVVPALKTELSEEDLVAVKRNLQNQGIEVDDESIMRVWKPLHRFNFLEKEIQKAKECSKVYYLYENDLDSDMDCSHVILFWRLQRVLEFTANSLRRQLIENECKRIEREIIDVLEEYGEDEEKKAKLLSGKRVELAEELSRVRRIQEKLDEFISSLNQEA
ncbi:Dynamin-like protein [Fragariocoptes setiger]|uniref:Dynamin-like GTPase OPA1, mitochondrial n=1 Tax=Fragariocoptes setiger TaxID=1670756 RepID=A0ABQ7SAW9_9ACAR|nr:Dynamin-like protein [Fragariocoptes setiger]